MANLNRIILIGKLTADPEARSTVEGLAVTKFALAVDRYRGPNHPTETDFIDIVTWRKLAEICGQYLKKDRLVLIEGRIQVRFYDTEAGKRKWVTEVIARNMKMLGTPPKEAAKIEGGEAPSETIEDEIPGSSEIPVEGSDSDLPF